MTKNITFIGCGNMGSSLIKGLLNSGYPAQNIFGIEPDKSKRQVLEKELAIQTAEDHTEFISNADVLVLAVKPQILLTTLNTIKNNIPDECLIVTIAAGISCNSIERCLSSDMAVIRVMPNTPSLINLGAAGMYANKNVNAEQKTIAQQIAQAVGIAHWVNDENLIDVITAVSGSGPAYYFFMMEIMNKVAIDLGLDPEQASSLVKQTAIGAAKMASISTESLEQLRKNVTSPGGTTEAAIHCFIENNFEQIVRQAVNKAKDRSKELSEQFGEKQC